MSKEVSTVVADPSKLDQQVSQLVTELRGLGSEQAKAQQARFAIRTERGFGVIVPELRKLAKRIGTQHELALRLYDTDWHDAQLLACFIADPLRLTQADMEAWAEKFDSWDLCDQATTSLFDQSPLAFAQAERFARRQEEWLKRAGFALYAGLAVHAKKATDSDFEVCFQLIEEAAFDARNFVKKGVNWALRNLGKRNSRLRERALQCAARLEELAAERLRLGKSPEIQAALWVARDAKRELLAEKTVARLSAREEAATKPGTKSAGTKKIGRRN